MARLCSVLAKLQPANGLLKLGPASGLIGPTAFVAKLPTATRQSMLPPVDEATRPDKTVEIVGMRSNEE